MLLFSFSIHLYLKEENQDEESYYEIRWYHSS